MVIVGKDTDIASIDFQDGALILLDKPLEWSSFSAVNKIRWTLKYHYGIKKLKVGHAGTLDPLATGLLLICTGSYTKRINELMGLDKEYDATIKIGAQTASYDSETPEEDIKDCSHVEFKDIKASVTKFIGAIDQLAPVYSALKIDGQPMYKLARKGIFQERKKRRIVIHDISLSAFNTPYIDLTLRCSKGCYVRSLAHDLGEVLDTGAYLTALRRTAIGDFKIEDSITIEEFTERIKSL